MSLYVSLYGATLRETLDRYAERYAEDCTRSNLLFNRIHEGVQRREAEAWLAGAPDVSMGTSYEMTGWGDGRDPLHEAYANGVDAGLSLGTGEEWTHAK